jgi:tripeptide aminopeptidase
MVNKERLVQSFIDYVSIDSESSNEKQFGEYILKHLQSLGFETQMDGKGQEFGSNYGNIIARLPGNKNSEPILFSCHLDTVSPGKNIKPVIKEGTIYSDGKTILGADDKAGIAAMIEAIRVIREENIAHGDIELVFSFMEEKGLNGAKSLDYSLVKSKVVYTLDEGAVGRIVVQGPAQDKIDVRVLGKAAHAGVSPEEGISAILVAAKALSQMKLLRVDEDTTANFGSIHGGGETNIVPSEVVLKGEARSLVNEKLSAQTKHMIDCFERAAADFGAHVEIEHERMYPAFKVAADDEIVIKAQNALRTIGLASVVAKTGGGSDTNIYNSKGLKAVTLGSGEMKPHTLEECVRIVDLVDLSRLVIALIQEYAR